MQSSSTTRDDTSVPLQASPPLSSVLHLFKKCSRCGILSPNIFQRTISGAPYCIACLNAGAGLEEYAPYAIGLQCIKPRERKAHH